ncbi:MAG: type VI secretion system ATPase TssH, partial [Actinobacteria bacterium]|nr:type VI secretion system ATPase TssH [Actinomycetota bacterium]
MDFQKLTIKSQEAVAGASELARRAGNPEVYPEHLAVALLDQELPRTLAERAGASVADLRARAETTLRSKPTASGAAQQPRASAAFSRVLDDAEHDIRSLDHEYVTDEHHLHPLYHFDR